MEKLSINKKGDMQAVFQSPRIFEFEILSLNIVDTQPKRASKSPLERPLIFGKREQKLYKKQKTCKIFAAENKQKNTKSY